MDGTAAIQNNLEALKRILAGLVAMAGLSVLRACGDCPHPEVLAAPRRTLPRHLRLAILRLLRPAESAARRLIIAAARGLVVALPCQRKRETRPMTAEPLLRRFGIAVVVSSADLASTVAVRRTAARDTPRSRSLALPLFDPPRRLLSKRRRTVPAHASPRILFPGVAEPFSLPSPPSPDDPIDATRLALRFAALAAALDDLPGQARRFARWKAAHDAAGAQTKNRDAMREGPGRRISPLRRGRPPGGRLTRFDPSARARGTIREIDEVLAHAHALALYALERPDTS